MKGKKTFTKEEIAKIRENLKAKHQTPSEDKKSWRDILRRRCKFYITDFGSRGSREFNETDLDRLIADGSITVM